MASKKLKKRNTQRASTCRACVGGAVLFLYGSISLGAAINNIVVGWNFYHWIIFLQDIFLALSGFMLMIFGISYSIVGIFFSRWDLCHIFVRVGRRTTLHCCYIMFFNGLIFLIFCIVSIIILHGTIDPYGLVIDQYTIFFGFHQTSFKCVYTFILWVVTVLCVLVYWLDFFISRTSRFLLNKKENLKKFDYINDLMKTDPVLRMNLICYHFEKGKKIVTYRGSKNWMYKHCCDSSRPFQTEKKNKGKCVLNVRIRKFWSLNDKQTEVEFVKNCEDYVKENLSRDTHLDFWVSMGIENHQPNVMMSCHKRDSIFLTWGCYLACAFFYLAICYRYILDNVDGKQDFCIIKRISTSESVSKERFDQSEPFPKYRERITTFERGKGKVKTKSNKETSPLLGDKKKKKMEKEEYKTFGKEEIVVVEVETEDSI